MLCRFFGFQYAKGILRGKETGLRRPMNNKIWLKEKDFKISAKLPGLQTTTIIYFL